MIWFIDMYHFFPSFGPLHPESKYHTNLQLRDGCCLLRWTIYTKAKVVWAKLGSYRTG